MTVSLLPRSSQLGDKSWSQMIVLNEWNNSKYEVLLETGKWDHFIEFLTLCFEMSIQFINKWSYQW